jgi:hypothetical protein
MTRKRLQISSSELNQGDVLRARQLAEAKEKRRQELEELNKAQPQPRAPVAPAQRQSVAASMHGSALDQRPVDKTTKTGKPTGLANQRKTFITTLSSGMQRETAVRLCGHMKGLQRRASRRQKRARNFLQRLALNNTGFAAHMML